MVRRSQNRGNGNYSKGLVLGLSAGGLTYVVIQLFHIITGIQHINESTKPDTFKDAPTYIVITDTITGRKDTMRLSDYLQHKKLAADTSSKPQATSLHKQVGQGSK